MTKVLSIINGIDFPPRNTKFKLEDFFQTDVDDFEDGYFKFISADIIKVKTNKRTWEDCELVDKYGWKIKTYCYTAKYYYSILICSYSPKPWHNGYTIKRNLAFKDICIFHFKVE